MSEIKTTRPELVTAPTSQPVTLAQARTQVFLASDDGTHDTELSDLIDVAVEQWESDTDSILMQRTLRVYLEVFDDDEIYLPSRPVISISSVKYYDDLNTLQTLASTAYDLDASSRAVRLKFNQVWPSTSTRWDAGQVNYIAGYASAGAVPAIAKRAILLLVGYYFAANRGDNDRPNDMRAYERLKQHYLRASYP